MVHKRKKKTKRFGPAAKKGAGSRKRKRDEERAAKVPAEELHQDVEETKAGIEKAKEENEEAKAARLAAQVRGELVEPGPEKLVVHEDPYLLADAAYIQKDTRWRNKQRVLVFTSRSITATMRHFCEDIRRLLPHHKRENKWEKKAQLRDINEACELQSCNNAIFFDSRRKSDLYMWLARVPLGPTFKFQVMNVHTTTEVRLAGNCLHGSRPILHFDNAFQQQPHLRMLRTMLIQMFGTPRNHPKSKPFHDHIMNFYYLDKKIWFRHYQISPETAEAANDPEKQELTEIGPRFVLEPIRLFSGSFCGQPLYVNNNYSSPSALRKEAKRAKGSEYAARVKRKAERYKFMKEVRAPQEDPADDFIG